MTIDEAVNSALSAVLANTWANELPQNPTWPAFVFEIATQPEKLWVQDGGYDLHTVTVSIIAKTKAEIKPLQALIDQALEAVPTYLADEERGDAQYEADPNLYAYYSNHVIRTRRS